jgi:hypothetical protein
MFSKDEKHVIQILAFRNSKAQLAKNIRVVLSIALKRP